MIPRDTQYQIDRYVKDRIPPGGFLHAVLSNDLLRTFEKADLTNVRALHDIVGYVYSNVPASAWGSADAVRRWLERREQKSEKNHPGPGARCDACVRFGHEGGWYSDDNGQWVSCKKCEGTGYIPFT